MTDTVSDERRSECTNLLAAITQWASHQPDIQAVAVVGSWARDAARMDSDLDVVVLTALKDLYLVDSSWIVHATGEPAPLVHSQDWGPVTERRVRLTSGFEIEFGFATPTWAGIDPVDDDTAKLVAAGMRVLHDPAGRLTKLAEATRTLS